MDANRGPLRPELKETNRKLTDIPGWSSRDDTWVGAILGHVGAPAHGALDDVVAVLRCHALVALSGATRLVMAGDAASSTLGLEVTVHE